MLNFAKIGLVGLVLMSSKMANAGNWQDDYKCHTEAKPLFDSFGQPVGCNPSLSHICNKDGWCELKTSDDDDDDTNDKANEEEKDKDKTDSDDDVTNTPSTTSDCHTEICIDFTSGNGAHPAFLIMRDVYKYSTLFVKDKEDKNGRNLYKGIDLNDKMKKPKYAMWWKKGFWMVGHYENRDTLIAFASAQSDEKCPEKINYDWSYYYSYENAFKSAGEGMSVFNECKISYY